MTPFLIEKYGDRVASTAIEVFVTDTRGKYMLPDDSILREKRVVGIFINNNPDDDRFSPLERPLIDDAALFSGYLTLVDVNNHVIDKHSLIDICVNLSDRTLRVVDICRFNPSKSYVQIADAANKIAVGESILLHFIYIFDRK